VVPRVQVGVAIARLATAETSPPLFSERRDCYFDKWGLDRERTDKKPRQSGAKFWDMFRMQNTISEAPELKAPPKRLFVNNPQTLPRSRSARSVATWTPGHGVADDAGKWDVEISLGH